MGFPRGTLGKWGGVDRGFGGFMGILRGLWGSDRGFKGFMGGGIGVLGGLWGLRGLGFYGGF